MKIYDAIVVGSGASGGMVCRTLAERGFDVLLLEAGRDPRLDPPRAAAPSASSRKSAILQVAETELGALGDWIMGAPDPSQIAFAPVADGRRETYRPSRQVIQSTCRGYGEGSRALYVDDVDQPYSTIAAQPFSWIRGRQLGGRTQIWKRVCPRLRDADFRAPARDQLGPAWPIDERTLDPYYERVEQMLRVVGAVEAGAPSYMGALPQRAMTQVERDIQSKIERQQAPWQVRLAPYATPLGPSDDRETFDRRINVPSGGRDPTWDVSVRHSIEPALRTGKLTIRTGAVVHRVLYDDGGTRAEGVAFRDQDTLAEQTARGKFVVLAASALESTRLLMLSEHEDASRTLGHYLCDHLFGVGVVAHKSDPFVPQSFPDLFFPRWKNGPSDRENRPFSRSYQLVGELRALRGGPLRRWQTALVLAGQGEVLPVYENHVALDPAVKDAWGVPSLRIHYARTDNEVRMAADIVETAAQIAEAAGFEIIARARTPLLPGNSVHELGTARMGASPDDSVVSRDLHTWRVPNLYVTDGAVFPSAACQNPTLTIMALSARAGDHIAARLGRT